MNVLRSLTPQFNRSRHISRQSFEVLAAVVGSLRVKNCVVYAAGEAVRRLFGASLEDGL